jgi:hypothetical protein
MQYKFLFTYSEQERLAVFLPAKTGTIHAAFILNHFNFKTNFHGKDDGNFISKDDYFIHHHFKTIPKGYEDYDVIYTTRNPYARLVSYHYHTKRMSGENAPNDNTFKEYFSNRVNNGCFNITDGFDFVKTPKYLLRMEHLYEDYIKIPFIRDSKLNQSGILYELCNKKIHAKTQETKPLKYYYTQDMADYVYEMFKPYFDLTGYDKDSWKIL